MNPDSQPNTTDEVFTIATFCSAHRMSRAQFYKLKLAGKAPKTYKIGRRVFITKRAAQRWLDDSENAGYTATTKLGCAG